MATIGQVPLTSESVSVGDALAQLGGVSPKRIPWGFPIGTATEENLLHLLDHTDRICELVDGVLVEKPMGSRESILALYVGYLIRHYLTTNKLGIVLGADGLLRILPGQVRVPDVAFIRWERLPGRKIPEEPIFGVVPNLAVEILSPGNTPGEMKRKLEDYFTAGVQLVWYVDPATRTARAYQAADRSTDYTTNDAIPGGEVLPGFEMSLSNLFAELDAAG